MGLWRPLPSWHVSALGYLVGVEWKGQFGDIFGDYLHFRLFAFRDMRTQTTGKIN
uniref:Isoamylase isoform 1 n=1 Tax=Solanum tuberosum TaxID=4113 RepID=M1CYW3_SOLTU